MRITRGPGARSLGEAIGSLFITLILLLFVVTAAGLLVKATILTWRWILS